MLFVLATETCVLVPYSLGDCVVLVLVLVIWGLPWVADLLFVLNHVLQCGVISPRFDITLPNMEKWTSNLLPSRQFG